MTEKNTRLGWVLGGAAGIVGVAAVGGAAWAAYSFLAVGPQPAEALPSSTLAYASLDLDPDGAQKMAALRTLRQFPSFRDKVGVESDGDLREWVVGELLAEGCEVDFDADVAPWLGDRFAVAVVDGDGDAGPTPSLVLQVTDADAATAGLEELSACAQGTEASGWAVDGDWAVVTSSEEAALDVIARAAESSLADDDTFRHWTGETGDSGIATLYAAPDALEALGADAAGAPGSVPDPTGVCPGLAEGTEGAEEGAEGGAAATFGGAAATLRFDDGGIELEGAGDPGATVVSGARAGDIVADLPEEAAAVLALSPAEGWLDNLLAPIEEACQVDSSQLFAFGSAMTGLDLPDDLQTLVGDAVAVVLGETGEEAWAGGSPPVAVKVQGDTTAIEEVLGKVRAQSPGLTALESEAAGDALVIGPDPEFRALVAQGGALGDEPAFADVLPEADRASALLYLRPASVAGLVDAVAPDYAADVAVVTGVGVSAWIEDDTARGLLRLTTEE